MMSSRAGLASLTVTWLTSPCPRRHRRTCRLALEPLQFNLQPVSNSCSNGAHSAAMATASRTSLRSRRSPSRWVWKSNANIAGKLARRPVRSVPCSCRRACLGMSLTDFEFIPGHPAMPDSVTALKNWGRDRASCSIIAHKCLKRPNPSADDTSARCMLAPSPMRLSAEKDLS